MVDKAILLLNRKADISCRDKIGDTVLHILLKCERSNERFPKPQKRPYTWGLSFKAPKDLLMVFITAGADVYATNNEGKTPSRVALEYRREDEWIEALMLCGYDFEEVIACSIHHSTRGHQTSKLSFQEYCQQRQYRQHISPDEEIENGYMDSDSPYSDEDESEKIQSEEDAYKEDHHEEDDNEEIRGMTNNTERIVDGNMESFGGAEYAEYDMNIELDDEGNKYTYNAEKVVDQQVMGLDDIEGTNVNFDDWLDNSIDFMQSSDNFGMI